MKSKLKDLANNGRVQFGMCFVAAAAIVGAMELAKDDDAPARSPAPAVQDHTAPVPQSFRNAIPVQVVRP